MIPQSDLISPKYQGMQRLLHATRPYGERGKKWAKATVAVIRQYEASSVLDYGSGRGSLKPAVKKRYGRPGLRFDEYDPCIVGKDSPPMFADVLTVTDVLEHVEPDRLDSVLAHLKLLARRAIFVVVALVPTAHILADGRNAHLIVRPAGWWLKKFRAAGFKIKRTPACARKKKSHELSVVLEP